MPEFYFIKFYDRQANSYKFIGYVGWDDINGTAIQSGQDISIDGSAGKGSLSLSNDCRYLTGYIKSPFYFKHTINYELYR